MVGNADSGRKQANRGRVVLKSSPAASRTISRTSAFNRATDRICLSLQPDTPSPGPKTGHNPAAGLIPMGEVSDTELRIVVANIQVLLNLQVEMLAPMPVPEEAFQAHRGQYDAGLILRHLAESSFPRQRCVLTVTNVDLCTPILTYVFGEAEMGRKMALVSTFRLRNMRDGFPAPADVYYERLVKVALHEVAHTLSLYHCETPGCLMRFSPKVQDLDELDIRFCKRCGFALRHTLKEDLK